MVNKNSVFSKLNFKLPWWASWSMGPMLVGGWGIYVLAAWTQLNMITGRFGMLCNWISHEFITKPNLSSPSKHLHEHHQFHNYTILSDWIHYFMWRRRRPWCHSQTKALNIDLRTEKRMFKGMFIKEKNLKSPRSSNSSESPRQSYNVNYRPVPQQIRSLQDRYQGFIAQCRK